jgi:hypothetical protein
VKPAIHPPPPPPSSPLFGQPRGVHHHCSSADSEAGDFPPPNLFFFLLASPPRWLTPSPTSRAGRCAAQPPERSLHAASGGANRCRRRPDTVSTRGPIAAKRDHCAALFVSVSSAAYPVAESTGAARLPQRPTRRGQAKLAPGQAAGEKKPAARPGRPCGPLPAGSRVKTGPVVDLIFPLNFRII